MADKGGTRKTKDQQQAQYLKAKGEYHGYRHAPWSQGIGYPKLTDAGSAAHRRKSK